jgi:hypothetical protein
MPLLQALDDPRLYPGDILRLDDDYDLGPGSGPVDLMVFDPRDDGCGLGLIVTSGYKAGLVLHVFPADSRPAAGSGLCAAWLLANWDAWMVYTYHPGVIPVEKVRVLRKEGRTMPEEI